MDNVPRPVHTMLDSRSANNNPLRSWVVDRNSAASSTDGGQLSTVYEDPRTRQIKESRVRESSSLTGLRSKTYKTPSGNSRDASPGSAIEKFYCEKVAEQPRRSLKHKSQSIGVREQNAWSRDTTPLQHGTDRDSMAPEFPKPQSPKKTKSRSLKTIIRRMFGKGTVKNRISMPAPTTYRNDPNTFITSATDLQTPRSASAPTHEVSRSSALGSHAPFSLKVPPDTAGPAMKAPPRPNRSPPVPLMRPRRASLPSDVRNVHGAESSEDARTGFGLHDVQDHTADRANIGCAVTSGSNPKRRSRSAGTLHDTAKEHRMSPIQWRRQARRRSDEIRYWRESAEGSSPVPGDRNTMDSEILRMSPVVSHGEGVAKDRPATGEPGAETEENHGNFNFGLSTGAVEHQEQIGIEERMVTLEIKLMDFEYAISKLQASLASPVSPPSHRFHSMDEPRRSGDSERAQRYPQSPLSRSKRPSDDFYASSAHGTPAIQTHPRPSQQSIHTPTTPEHHEPPSENRPTSVATTLKANPRDRTPRTSTSGLTIEHYHSLMALIRREHSERLRLEDEVLLLQGQVHLLMDSRRPPSSPDPRVYESRSVRHRSPEESVSIPRGRYRRRSSTYTETDTDDASFHEVYVTPVERGEYEREQLGVEEEGVAF
ncbi:hypothetical protein MMC07_008194 [Pseudocyphellaria aurata]|nr:hypothetical protein [Pseudocyphellaria aurata]